MYVCICVHEYGAWPERAATLLSEITCVCMCHEYGTWPERAATLSSEITCVCMCIYVCMNMGHGPGELRHYRVSRMYVYVCACTDTYIHI